jgi:hypothetical protein
VQSEYARCHDPANQHDAKNKSKHWNEVEINIPQLNKKRDKYANNTQKKQSSY